MTLLATPPAALFLDLTDTTFDDFDPLPKGLIPFTACWYPRQRSEEIFLSTQRNALPSEIVDSSCSLPAYIWLL